MRYFKYSVRENDSAFVFEHINESLVSHTRFTALCPGLPRWAGTRKVKPIWLLLKQETVSGSGISWAICKSAPRSRQITTPVPHHSQKLVSVQWNVSVSWPSLDEVWAAHRGSRWGTVVVGGTRRRRRWYWERRVRWWASRTPVTWRCAAPWTFTRTTTHSLTTMIQRWVEPINASAYRPISAFKT